MAGRVGRILLTMLLLAAPFPVFPGATGETIRGVLWLQELGHAPCGTEEAVKRTLEGLPGVVRATIWHHRAYIDFAFQIVTLSLPWRSSAAVGSPPSY